MVTAPQSGDVIAIDRWAATGLRWFQSRARCQALDRLTGEAGGLPRRAGDGPLQRRDDPARRCADRREARERQGLATGEFHSRRSTARCRSRVRSPTRSISRPCTSGLDVGVKRIVQHLRTPRSRQGTGGESIAHSRWPRSRTDRSRATLTTAWRMAVSARRCARCARDRARMASRSRHFRSKSRPWRIRRSCISSIACSPK